MKSVLLVLAALVLAVTALNNGLGKTPQMGEAFLWGRLSFSCKLMVGMLGWNSWNHFGCNVDEDLIKTTAQAIVKTGLKDAGYVYVNIDDCWQVSRDSNGFIQADSQRFPSGMKSLASYGLWFGCRPCVVI
jgi:alpha-galactosidase